MVPIVFLCDRKMAPLTDNGGRRHLSHRAVTGLSISQIVIGCLEIILGSVIIALDGTLEVVTTPVWIGVYFVITGLIGFRAARWRTTGRIVTTMVMCIVSASLCTPALIVLLCVVVNLEAVCHDIEYGCRHGTPEGQMARLTIASTLLLLAVTNLILVIITSAFCCGAVCCKSGNQDLEERAGQQVIFITSSSHVIGMPGANQQENYVADPRAVSIQEKPK
ncbi:uncharacterized protein [Ptychodera flava]|uniref:uncharacterized protein n=1 Tax=Ptychodera flava TaxID=63121 RepID=UPI00396A616C